jgi:hypothetical protein
MCFSSRIFVGQFMLTAARDYLPNIWPIPYEGDSAGDPTALVRQWFR